MQKQFYAEMIDRYGKFLIGEWLKLKDDDPFIQNQYFHLLTRSENDTIIRTKCGLNFPKKENQQADDDANSPGFNYMANSAVEGVHIKCYGCLKKEWEEIENEYLSRDPEYFESPSIHEVELDEGENRHFVFQYINRYGVKGMDRLFNRLLKEYIKMQK